MGLLETAGINLACLMNILWERKATRDLSVLITWRDIITGKAGTAGRCGLHRQTRYVFDSSNLSRTERIRDYD